MEKKMTKKDLYYQIINLAYGEELQVSIDDIVAFAQKEIELLNKKSLSKSKKEVAKARENDRYMEIIVSILDNTKAKMTVGEIQLQDEELKPLSNQKMTSLIKKLKDSGIVSRVEEKGKAYFFTELEEEVSEETQE